jgi:hypothetical protein
VPGIGVREGFEDAERRLRVAQGEPWPGQRLLVGKPKGTFWYSPAL